MIWDGFIVDEIDVSDYLLSNFLDDGEEEKIEKGELKVYNIREYYSNLMLESKKVLAKDEDEAIEKFKQR